MNDIVADEKKVSGPKKPSDYKDMDTFLKYVINLYNDDWSADKENRKEADEDANFVAGRQWDDQVYQRRLSNNKPALTINRLPAFIAQVIGNRRLNETVIKILPDNDSDKMTAKVREGIIRNIQKNSTAVRAYDTAFQNQVIGGLGNFQIALDFADDDVFEQEIKIEPIHNPEAVVWDKNSYDPTGKDADHVFVTDNMARDVFKKRYPDAIPSDFESNESYSYQNLSANGWVTKDTVRLATFWRMRTHQRTLAMMQDGSTVDVTDERAESYAENLMLDDDGEPIMREARVKYAEMYLVSGAAVLEGPFTLPINRVPVFRCPGWEINTADYRTRFGIVRFLRDPQRLHNYWRSIIAEKLMLTPKAKWLATDTAVEGLEKQFRQAHLSDDPLLIYNGTSGQKPEIVAPAQMEAALIQEAGIAAQDIKDISNLHEASLGQQSNEVSGKAIMARQRVGETGTQVYQSNMNMAIEEAGKVANQLIPYVYDTPRVVKIIGDDEETVNFVKVNYGDSESVDITKGKYNVTIVTGPNTSTKRVEAAESMMAAVNAMPDTFASVADLIAEAQDWPGADKMASRIRSTMPPNVLGDDLPPEQQQQMAQEAQKQQVIEQITLRKEMAEIAAKEADVAVKEAQVAESRARTLKTMIEAGLAEDRALAEVDKIYANIESEKTKDALQTIDALTGENNV